MSVMRFCALAAITACWLMASGAAAQQRNVILFVTDDQGVDAGCYGNPVVQTPHLDALAADGTRFEYGYCTTSSCSPTRSVILTGLHNHATGQYGLEHRQHNFRSLARLKSLPILLGEAGYRTVRIGKFHVYPESSYRFETRLVENPRSTVAMAEQCRELIESDSDQPFFLYFCTTDPHRGGGVAEEIAERPDRFGNKPPGESYPGVEPVRYDPADVVVPPFLPDTPTCRAELAQYYESVSRIDAGFGRLVEILQQAGKYDETLIIFISDNGIPFVGAKTTVYEPGLHVPFVVRNPHEPRRGVVSRALVSLVDLTPTILDFAGVEAPRGVSFHGRSLLPILAHEQPEGWDEVYASHTFHEVTMYYPMRVVRKGPHKLIWNIAYQLPYPFARDLWDSATWQDFRTSHGDDPQALNGQRTIGAFIDRPQFELYDLERDPHELQNLADDPQHADTMARLQQKLRDFQQRTDDPWQLKWERE